MQPARIGRAPHAARRTSQRIRVQRRRARADAAGRETKAAQRHRKSDAVRLTEWAIEQRKKSSSEQENRQRVSAGQLLHRFVTDVASQHSTPKKKREAE